MKKFLYLVVSSSLVILSPQASATNFAGFVSGEMGQSGIWSNVDHDTDGVSVRVDGTGDLTITTTQGEPQTDTGTCGDAHILYLGIGYGNRQADLISYPWSTTNCKDSGEFTSPDLASRAVFLTTLNADGDSQLSERRVHVKSVTPSIGAPSSTNISLDATSTGDSVLVEMTNADQFTRGCYAEVQTNGGAVKQTYPGIYKANLPLPPFFGPTTYECQVDVNFASFCSRGSNITWSRTVAVTEELILTASGGVITEPLGNFSVTCTTN